MSAAFRWTEVAPPGSGVTVSQHGKGPTPPGCVSDHGTNHIVATVSGNPKASCTVNTVPL